MAPWPGVSRMTLITSCWPFPGIPISLRPIFRPSHPAQESLAEVIKAAARATDLVRRILAFSRPKELKLQVVRLPSLVEEVLQLLRATLPANIQFRSDFADRLPPVAADATQIHQVIVNLAVNGAHAVGSKGGVLEFRLQSAPVRDAETARSLGLARRRLCPPVRQRQRMRHGSPDSRPDFQSILHYQGSGRGNRAWAFRRARHYHQPWRRGPRLQRAGKRDHISSLFSGRAKRH